MTRVLALTGNIGSGKSTVAAMLAELGALVISADEVARRAVAPGSPALAAITARFGPAVLRSDGTLDREALARRVFGDENARRDLEAITHPPIRDLMMADLAAALAKGPPLVVLEVPLLFETGLDRQFPETLLVIADDELRLRRICVRDGCDAEHARLRMAAQMPQDDKRARATHVLTNNAGRDELRRQIADLWPRLIQA
jgi:dephospho-CoA kinase